MAWCYTHLSYYLILLAFGLWCFAFSRSLSFAGIAGFIRSWRAGILICAALTIVLQLAVPTQFRVLSDEANLVSISKSMLFERKVDKVTEGYWYHENFHPIGRSIDRRPLMFSFFTHLLHLITGYRVWNAFAVNAAFLFALLFISFFILRRLLSLPAAVAGVLFLASQPVVSQSGNSAGLEMGFTVLFLACSAMLIGFWDGMTSRRAMLIWTTALVFAHTRYEAAALAGILVLSMIIFKKLNWEVIRPYWPVYALSPLTGLPTVWLRLLSPTSSWSELPKDTGIFGVEHFLRNNRIALEKLPDLSFYLPYNPVVNCAGLAGLVVFVVWAVRRRMAGSGNGTAAPPVLAVVLSLALLWVVLTSYTMADLTQPSQSRFFLPFVVLLTLSAAWLLHHVGALRTRLDAALALGLCSMLIFFPVSIENRFSDSRQFIRENDHLTRFFKNIGDRNILIIHSHPGLWTVHDYGAVNFKRANRRSGPLLQMLNKGYFRDIYVVQRLDRVTGKPLPGFTIHPAFKLEAIDGFFNGAHSIRVSRVLKDPAEKAVPPA
jgi:hypothetical protein